jgi:hypothetical protein
LQFKIGNILSKLLLPFFSWGPSSTQASILGVLSDLDINLWRKHENPNTHSISFINASADFFLKRLITPSHADMCASIGGRKRIQFVLVCVSVWCLENINSKWDFYFTPKCLVFFFFSLSLSLQSERNRFSFYAIE